MYVEDRFRSCKPRVCQESSSSGFQKVLSELHDVSARLATEHFKEVNALSTVEKVEWNSESKSENKSSYCGDRSGNTSLFASFRLGCVADSPNKRRTDIESPTRSTRWHSEIDAVSPNVELHHDDIILQEREGSGGVSEGPGGGSRASAFVLNRASYAVSSPNHPESSRMTKVSEFLATTSSSLSPGNFTAGHQTYFGDGATFGLSSQDGSVILTSFHSTALEPVHMRFAIKDCWVGHADVADIRCTYILEHAEAYWGREDSETVFGRSTVAAEEFNALTTRHNLRAATKKATMGHTKSSTERVVMHPFSKKRLVWSFLGLMFVMYDFAVVPIDVCFESDSEPILGTAILLIARIFWTIDILLNFATGVFLNGTLVLDPKIVARTYMRTWFILDLFLVTVEWTLLALESLEKAQAVSIVRGVRWVRMFRVMRLLQLVRVTKLKPLLLEIVGHSSEDLKILLQFLFCTVGFVASAHLCACMWYLLGNELDHGWVRAANVHGSLSHRYTVALQYFYARARGTHSSIHVQTTVEIGLDITFLCLCTIALALYTGLATHVVLAWANSDSAQLHKLAGRYLKRHKITRKVAIRARNFLAACQLQGIGEMLSDERKLLRKLPLQLQEDLQYEARAPTLSSTPFLLDLNYTNPRAMRHLCHHAVTELMAVQEETVFALGDQCSCAVFVADGELEYRSSNESCTIRPRNCLCEAVLWTRWEHIGTLHANFDSLLLLLDAEKFSQAIVVHKLAFAHAVKYARVFVSRLNESSSSDVTLFEDLDLECLDDAYQEFSNDESHLLFISHYKAEAGTEASLMRDALEQILRMDPSYSLMDCISPVFVDSEGLEDLARLKSHVEGSSALVLLLTPGLLTRPWCLLEIVIAFRNGLRIVPVEVQRPGMSYQYPDEEFFRKLEQDQILDADGKGILEGNDCTMADVVDGVRHVFQKIALPFSPHKSWNVRHAELVDILKRCTNGVTLATKPKRSQSTDDGFSKKESDKKVRVSYGTTKSKKARPFRLFRPSMAFGGAGTRDL